MYVWKKNIKLIFLTLLIIIFLIFTFSFPLRQLLLSDYTLMLSSQTEWYHFHKKHISFTNGIFDMQTSLAIPFTILKTMNHAYLIFNMTLTPKYPCGICAKDVAKNHAVCCDICNLWVHIKRNNIKFCYRKLQNSQDP